MFFSIIKITFILKLIFLSVTSVQAKTQVLHKQYDGFMLYLDCSNHGAIAFQYSLTKDTEDIFNNATTQVIRKDASVPDKCQPGSTQSYRLKTGYTGSSTFNAAHLVPPGHMTSSAKAYMDTFYVTNILPQSTRFNTIKGAWYQTEKITECYRNISDLVIWGGVIWGDSNYNDYFIHSHGIKTPDYFWKVIFRKDTQDHIAWLFPNNKETVASVLDDHLVSLDTLINVLDFIPDFTQYIPADNTDIQHVKSWNVFHNFQVLRCDGQRTTMR